MADFRRKLISLGLLSGVVTPALVLTGCSSTAGSSMAVLAAIQQNPPAGYTMSVSQNSGPDMVPDPTLHLARPLGPSVAEECIDLLKFGESIGTTHWFTDSNLNVTIPVSGYEAQAQIACVNILGSMWDDSGEPRTDGGSASINLWGVVPNIGGQHNVQIYLNALASEGRIFIEIFPAFDAVGKNRASIRENDWEQALAALDSGSLLLLTALDPLGKYLASHPRAAPDSWKTVTMAYDDADIDEQLGTVEVVRDSSTGEVFLHVVPRDGYHLALCVSVAPYDPEYFGVEDPGFGYGTGDEFSFDEVLRPRQIFGNSVTEDCPSG